LHDEFSLADDPILNMSDDGLPDSMRYLVDDFIDDVLSGED
jgi:hypothetical protein